MVSIGFLSTEIVAALRKKRLQMKPRPCKRSVNPSCESALVLGDSPTGELAFGRIDRIPQKNSDVEDRDEGILKLVSFRL